MHFATLTRKLLCLAPLAATFAHSISLSQSPQSLDAVQVRTQARPLALSQRDEASQFSLSGARRAKAAAVGIRAVADDATIANFLAALRAAKLNAYADLVKDNTDFILADGSAKVVLALTDEAVAQIPGWVLRNSAVLSATLLQHVLIGTFPDLPNNLTAAQSRRIHTVGYSMLSQPPYANLPGGNGQALALSSTPRTQKGEVSPDQDNGKGMVNEALNDAELRGDSFVVGAITVVPIEHAITVPGTLQYTLDAVVGQHLKQISPLLATDRMTVTNVSLPAGVVLPAAYKPALTARLDALDAMPGLTVFVPRTAAVNAFLTSGPGQTLLKGNGNGDDAAVAALLAIAGQHMVEARTLYSPIMRDLCEDGSAPPVTTSSGQLLGFQCTGSGKGRKYATSVRLYRAGDTARTHVVASAELLQTDIMFTNGVLHIIDNVLLSTDKDEGAAGRARDAALRKASAGISGPLNGENCGDGGMGAGELDGPEGVTRPPLGVGSSGLDGNTGTTTNGDGLGKGGNGAATSSAAPGGGVRARGSSFVVGTAAVAIALVLAI
ncbi:hypothetical protein OC834_000526 [Tilletia horrida]|nr:hypothetical protein OC834_000526 [Tilletia horrida]KAK0560554.1 hypothetical protein OC844_003682 [Tilletia horrida]